MTASAGPALHRLHHQFGERVGFVSLYVREAHPGDRYPQAASFEDKLRYAREYQRRDGITWPVAVDDVDGPLHRQLEPLPHAAYLMAQEGTIAGRVLWANDERVLRRALQEVVAGRAPGTLEPHVVPMVLGTSEMYDRWEAAGGHAKTDVLRQAPPMYVAGRVAHALHRLPPMARGAVGMIAPALVPVVAAALWKRGTSGR